MDTEKNRIAVIGAGSWGTALAVLLSRNHYPVNFWGRNSQHLQLMQESNCNQKYLPNVQFPDLLTIQHTLEDCLKNVNEILLVVPSNGMRETLVEISPLITADTRIAIASKGLESDSLKLLHEVVEDVLSEKQQICVISGPTFAKEVSQKLPTAITVAAENDAYAARFSGYLSNEYFRAYTSNDIIGVQIGGAAKNVMAIAAGIADGLGFGANTRAALITRALAELSRLGVKLGGQHDTFMGLAGLGDLLLTCTDNQSRNRRVGLGLAKGLSTQQILDDLGQVAEGISTTKKVHQLAKNLKIEMPIVEQVYQVLYQQKKPFEAVQDLLARHTGAENG